MNNFKQGDCGKFVAFATWVDKVCENCGQNFRIKASALKYGRGRCCSRKCVDENKKKNVGDKNGMFGKTTSERQKKIVSELASRMWKDEKFRSDFHAKREDYYRRRGYYPGHSPVAKQKRKETYSKMPIETKRKNRQKTEDMCLKLYGKTSLQLRREALALCKVTNIEKKVQLILEKHGIRFIPKYPLPFEGSYREYDFFIEDKKLLIEADGDFWHANPSMWNDKPLLEVQITNIANDELKNKLASDFGFTVLRFWESEINADNFETLFLAALKKHEVL